MSTTKENKEPKLRKIVYFDDMSASEYMDIANGAHLEWEGEEGKERIAQIIAEIDAEVGAGFNLLSWLKLNANAKTNGIYDNTSKLVISSKLSNTILTDFIETAHSDEIIKSFNGTLYAQENSLALYKMYSPYTVIMPEENMPLDFNKLNDALEIAKGYYEMILQKNENKIILRFNSKTFRNNYNISDLTKMNLTYYAIKVGTCRLEKLDMQIEFNFERAVPTAQDVLEKNIVSNSSPELDVYDVILAGVEL